MQRITAVTKQNMILPFSPNLLDGYGNAGLSSRRTIGCLTTLPEYLLV
jgi:hypothetical protein